MTTLLFFVEVKVMKLIPIKFKNLDCPKCGEKDSIRFIDRFNNANDKIDNSKTGTYCAICIFCNQKYSLQWDNDKYLIVDPALIMNNFVDQFSDHEQRDIMAIITKEYELPQ